MINNLEKVVKGKYQNVKMEYNFHSHNYLCGHALGDVSDFVKEAIDNGLSIIGISDHVQSPIKTERPYMGLKEIDEYYLPQFEIAKKKYGDKITIKKGAEIEYTKGHDDYYDELLKRLDYLVLGQHFYYYNDDVKMVFGRKDNEEEAIQHYNQIIEGIKSGFFKIVAHLDIMVGMMKEKCSKKVIDKLEEAVKEAIKHNVFVEINVNGFRNNGFDYPTDALIRIVKKLNAKIVIGSDNHKSYDLVDDYAKKIICYCKEMKLNIVFLDEIRKTI